MAGITASSIGALGQPRAKATIVSGATSSDRIATMPSCAAAVELV
jgi:hypothetical protein